LVLQSPWQLMIDKSLAVKRDKVDHAFGRLEPDTLVAVERCLAVFLGIAK
jgi:mRNA interferase MazF